MPEALDVVVFDDPADPAFGRLQRSLERQEGAPRFAWHRAGTLDDALSALGVGPDLGPCPASTGTAPWALLVRESDVLAPTALAEVYGVAGTVGSTAGLIRLDLRDGGASGVQGRHGERLLVRRGCSPVTGPAEAPVVELSARLIAPLGRVAARRLRRVPWSLPAAADLVNAADLSGCRWDLDGLQRSLRSATQPWVLLGARRWLGRLAVVGLADKATVLTATGVSAVVLCAGKRRRPAWQRLEVAVGDALDVAAVLCRTADLRRVLDDRPDAVTVADVVTAVLAVAERTGRGGRYHHLGVLDDLDSMADGMPSDALGPATVPVVVPPAEVPVGDVSAVPATMPNGMSAGWAPRSVVPVELVVDRAGRRLLLSSPLAPLDRDSYPDRVVIGGVESLAFPGSDAVRVDRAGRSVRCGEDVRGRLLGYVPNHAPATCHTLQYGVALGRRALRHRFAVEVGAMPAPAADDNVMLFRAPSAIARYELEVTASTALVGGLVARPGEPVRGGTAAGSGVTTAAPQPMGETVFRHPDALGLAAESALPARRGPGLAARPSTSRRAVGDGMVSDRAVGYGSVVPRRGDIGTEAGDGWWFGPAPDPQEVPLLRWDSDGGPRYSTGLRPRRPDGRPDASARFVHVVGWVLAAGTPGAVVVSEWYHPVRRRWRYGGDATGVVPGGWVLGAPLCSLEPRPGGLYVPLWRSLSAVDEGTLLHLVSDERGAGLADPVGGWVRLAVEAGPSAGALADVFEEDEQLRRRYLSSRPWPGACPVVEMQHGGAEEGRRVLTVDPSARNRSGWVASGIAGYLPVWGGDGLDALRAALAVRSAARRPAGGAQQASAAGSAVLAAAGRRARTALARLQERERRDR